jgi:uncharacterized membrane protein
MIKLHPALSHFPIGFLIGATLLSVVNFTGWFAIGAEPIAILLGLGLGASLLSIGTGFYELLKLGDDSPAEKTLWIHVGLVATAITIFGVALVLELQDIREISLSVLVVGSLVLGLGGHYGGMLVYKYRVGLEHEE